MFSADVPDDVRLFAERFEFDIARGVWPERLVDMDSGAEIEGESSIGRAVLKEIHSYLCTKSKKYEPLRKNENEAIGVTIGIIAGQMMAIFNVELAVATAVVAYLIKLVVRVSQGVFCRMYKEI